MNYNNVYPWMYQPTSTTAGVNQQQFNQPYQNQQNFIPQPPQQNNGINWAQGEAGAKSFGVEPGRSALIMDSEQERFFIKTVDVTGVPLPLRIFEYKEVTEQADAPVKTKTNEQEYVTRDEFDKLKARIEAMSVKKNYPKREK